VAVGISSARFYLGVLGFPIIIIIITSTWLMLLLLLLNCLIVSSRLHNVKSVSITNFTPPNLISPQNSGRPPVLAMSQRLIGHSHGELSRFTITQFRR